MHALEVPGAEGGGGTPPGARGLALFARRHGGLPLLLGYLALLFGSLLFLTEGAGERDAFFHARFAQLLPELGFTRHFRWTQFSLWRDSFADKDFLYHLFLVPFCRDAGEPLPGAKIGTLVLALSAVALLYVVLARLKAPWPLAWAALLALGNGAFLHRLLMVRSHVLSISLFLAGLLFVLERRPRALFVVGVLYSLSYSFPVVLLVTVLPVALLDLLSGKGRRALGALAAAAAGVATGLVVHPYFPENVRTLWTVVKVAGLASAPGGSPLVLGDEFERGHVLVWLFQTVGASLPLVSLLVVSLVAWLRKGDAPDAEARAAVAVAGTWLAAFFLAQRSIEYYCPAAIVAAALLLRSLRRPTEGAAPPAPSPRRRWLPAAGMAGVALLAALLQPLSELQERNFQLRASPFPTEDAWRRNRYFDGAGRWMRANLAPRTTVFHLSWDDFPELFYVAPEMNYIVGLDPTFLWVVDPERSALMEETSRGKRPVEPARLRTAFGSDVLVVRRTRAALHAELRGGKLPVLYADPTAVIYSLSPSR